MASFYHLWSALFMRCMIRRWVLCRFIWSSQYHNEIMAVNTAGLHLGQIPFMLKAMKVLESAVRVTLRHRLCRTHSGVSASASSRQMPKKGSSTWNFNFERISFLSTISHLECRRFQSMQPFSRKGTPSDSSHCRCTPAPKTSGCDISPFAFTTR